MSIAVHDFIGKYNVLDRPTKQINNYLRQHPHVYKIALFANHIFRAAAMLAFGLALPFSAPVSLGICFAGSLFYRLTVETSCPYKFALPAFAGALAWQIGQPALVSLVSGVAFASLGNLAISLASLLPLTAYVTYVVLTVNYDVNDNVNRCCCQKRD